MNIRAPLTNPISTSNSFKLLPENSGNVLEANDVLSTKINNTVKDNKTSNANTSNENRKSTTKYKRNKNDQNKIVTAIVGDSMIEDVYGWELSDREEKVLVKHFSGSTTEDTKTYIQLPLKRDPDRVVIHVGTNDLRSSQDPVTIAKNIIDIAKNSTTNKNEILVSSIVLRRDSLNGEGRQVNNILQKLCVENSFAYVNYSNIKPRQHCNYRGVHLSTAGSKILAENFILAPSRQT